MEFGIYFKNYLEYYQFFFIKWFFYVLNNINKQINMRRRKVFFQQNGNFIEVEGLQKKYYFEISLEIIDVLMGVEIIG